MQIKYKDRVPNLLEYGCNKNIIYKRYSYIFSSHIEQIESFTF